MNLASLDLNLLVTLDALLEHRSVSRSAEQLGLSQPAVSAQLARLRRHFGDELLARFGNQYRLTPLAVQLRGRVRTAVTGVERVFSAEPDFDPATTSREFSLLTSDYGVEVFGRELAATLEREAPDARLRFLANTPAVVDNAVQSLTGIDLLVLPHGFIEGLPHQDLYRDEWVCLVADGNEEVGAALTVDQLRTMPWVVTYHGPTASTPAARQMRMLGIEPRVQVVTENFLTVPGLVAGTGRVALLQRRLADRVPADLGVRVLPCPFEAGPLMEAFWWHPMYEHDPEHRYLRDLLARVAGNPAS
ncbi:DNA-binding transcriptional LysR family regulator [Amycolatopsis bartoniae]|uniref:LysR family transcriptional regulator n=1 Tax=Amycolatopsis bartoniae TaxID=941986 RepID=UPI00119128FD|nr:LysR family transcriptional regulator [Amycolatopsis bartoniae]MBB2937913.1 DNA-binding transcriptional LysR family regulator [Amycolatopsis bartoniae]TVT08590.1 LysR family transcriptional regulator [Amycolatopsis bartoniae]